MLYKKLTMPYILKRIDVVLYIYDYSPHLTAIRINVYTPEKIEKRKITCSSITARTLQEPASLNVQYMM